MADISVTHPVADPPEPEWTLGERIRKLRSIMDLEQEDFGERFEKPVSYSLVSKWETGDREPKLSQLHEMESWGVVPKGFLVRSKWTAPGALRLIPGRSSGPAKMNQTPLPLFLTAADN